MLPIRLRCRRGWVGGVGSKIGVLHLTAGVSYKIVGARHASPGYPACFIYTSAVPLCRKVAYSPPFAKGGPGGFKQACDLCSGAALFRQRQAKVSPPLLKGGRGGFKQACDLCSGVALLKQRRIKPRGHLNNLAPPLAPRWRPIIPSHLQLLTSNLQCATSNVRLQPGCCRNAAVVIN